MTERDDLPSGPMPPLPPPSGSLDRLLHRAHAHRVRRRAAVLGSAAAVLLLAVGLPLALRGDDHPKSEVRTADDGRSTSTTEAPTTTVVATTSLPTSTSADPGVPGTTTRILKGRAVDPEGHPLAGIFVYSQESRDGSMRTRADGTYEMRCDVDAMWAENYVEWLSGVRIGGFAEDHSEDQNWAPTQIVAPSGPLFDWCRDPVDGHPDPAAPRIDTVLQPGGIVTGHYDDPYDPPFTFDGHAGTWARVLIDVSHEVAAFGGDIDRSDPFHVYLEGQVGAGNTYRILGVPPGTHQMTYSHGPAAGFPSVTVVAGQTTVADLHAPAHPATTTTATP